MQVTKEQIYALAPDGKSAQAARELVLADVIRESRISPGGDWLEARCQGSERQPYHVGVQVDGDTIRFGCDCPSRKYPCKHALGLLFLLLEDRGRFQEGEISPDLRQLVRMSGAFATLDLSRAGNAPGPADPATVGEALRKAIFDEPDEIANRLVYADWLDEQGDGGRAALAEFIRAQCELAGLTEEDSRFKELSRRERKLLSEHRQKWVEHVPKHLRGCFLLSQPGQLALRPGPVPPLSHLGSPSLGQR
jgi:uncharacterized protein (TIGR02996 family)